MVSKLNFSSLKAGEQCTGGALICSVVEKTAKSGSTYCVFTLSDGTQTMEGRYFNCALANVPDWARDSHVANVSLSADLYNGSLSYIIRKITRLDEGDFDLGDYIIKAPMDSKAMFDGILSMLSAVTPAKTETTPLYTLVSRIYNENRDRLLYWSAAKAIHHSMYGGLLYHTYRMMCLAKQILFVYPSLDSQLLLAAVALHDIGKLEELDTDSLGTAAYSLDGRLFNHLIIGIEMIDRAVDDSYDADEIACLKHCIASHHGSLEFGALVLPHISEAQILCYIDLIDSRIQQYETLASSMDYGQLSADKIYGLDNVQVYNPAFKGRRKKETEGTTT